MGAIEIRELAKAQIKHAQTRDNAYLQMCALQIPRQITENYNINMNYYYAQIESIESLSKEGHKIKCN